MTKKNIIGWGIATVCGAALLVFLDQYTKLLAESSLIGAPRVLIEGVFQLTYVQNRGAAFGVFQDGTMFFVCITIALMAALFYAFYRLPSDRKYHVLRVLIIVTLSGAIGNLIDRVSKHYVVDFLYFCLIDFPVFNVADIYVTCSAILAALLIFTKYKDDPFINAVFEGKKKASPDAAAAKAVEMPEDAPAGDGEVTEDTPAGDGEVTEDAPAGDGEVPEGTPAGDGEVPEDTPAGDGEME